MTPSRVQSDSLVSPLLPPEAQLLFLATMPRRANDDAALDRLLRSNINWQLVRELAEQEKLVPILWNRVRHHAKAIPAGTAFALQRETSVIEFRMAMTESALQRVIDELAREHIRVMLLKGAALATTVYSSFAERPMGDLDILVNRADAERAWKWMQSTGWKLELAGGEAFHASHQHLPGLLDPQGLHIVLEIHRAMLPPSAPFVLDEAEVWRTAQPVRVGSTEVLVPSDEHQLLHLCIHFAWSHMLVEGLGRTVRDVATLLDRGSVQWSQFAELAVRTRAATCAYWALQMSRTLAGAVVPGEILRRLRPRQPAAVSRALERAYISTELFKACPSVHLSRLLWDAGMRPVASGHGAIRPWQVAEMFRRAFQLGSERGVHVRLLTHLNHLSEWLRFVKAIGTPRRVI